MSPNNRVKELYQLALESRDALTAAEHTCIAVAGAKASLDTMLVCLQHDLDELGEDFSPEFRKGVGHAMMVCTFLQREQQVALHDAKKLKAQAEFDVAAGTG